MNFLQKLLGYILGPIHVAVFFVVTLVFHVIQVVALKLGGYSWHKRSVDYLNLFSMRTLWLIGTHVHFTNEQDLPTDRPIIFVANHQSLYDIPPFFWYLRKHHIKFVSKIELASGIPSISYNLRHGGSALIDRKNPKQALSVLKDFAQYIEKNAYGAVIFPEGTRSRTGVPKRFSPNGLKVLLKYAPSALVVPVTINHSWKLSQYGVYPMPVGVQPTWLVHPPIDPKGRTAETVLAEVEHIITSHVERYAPQSQIATA